MDDFLPFHELGPPEPEPSPVERYTVTVEYEVDAVDEEQAVDRVRQQLENDDRLQIDHEERLDYTVRRVD